MDGIDIFDMLSDFVEINFRIPEMNKDFSSKVKKYELIQKLLKFLADEI